MRILSLHNSLQAGAALSISDEIVGAITEERITRIKDHHIFPQKSISALLKMGGIRLQDVDKIVYGMVTGVVPDQQVLDKLLDDFELLSSKSPWLARKARERIYSETEWNRKHLEELNDWADAHEVMDRLSFIDHHFVPCFWCIFSFTL